MAHHDANSVPIPEADSLTGLESYKNLASISQASALVFSDLHDFQGLNQRHGYVAADAVLRTLASRLQRDLPPWRMFRVGGDEFLIAVQGPIDRQGAIDLARRLGTLIARPIEGIDERITAHVGILLRPVVDDGFEGYLVARELADLARRDNRPFFVADADWRRGLPLYCGEAIAIDAQTLIERLAGLSDRQRLDFAIWSMDADVCGSAPEVEWGLRYLDQAGTEKAAVLAFDGLRHDGTVSQGTGSSFFDPVVGWGLEAWARAISIVRAMARASFERDAEPLSCVARALLWIAAPPPDLGDALDHRSSTYLALGLRPGSSRSSDA